MYSPALGPFSAAICNYPIYRCLYRGAKSSATQYTFIVSTRPTSKAGQLNATTKFGAAINIATVKASLTISHKKNPNIAVAAFRDAKRPVRPRANKAAGKHPANAP